MRGLGKKVVALAAAAGLAMTLLVGCSSSVDNSEVAMTVGESEVTAGVANFYLRYQQASLESYYTSMLGEDVWTMEYSEDVTFEDNAKETSMNALQQLYILSNHMEEYNVTLTDEEMAAIDEAAAAFAEANTDEVKKLISGAKEIVAEVLRLLTVSEKMYDAITADVNTEVSDEEAAQKKLQYTVFSKTNTLEDGTTEDMSEDEVAALKKEAEEYLKGAKSSGSLEAYATAEEKTSSSLTFDAETTTLPTEVITAADQLKEGEFAELIETDTAFYVVELTSIFDEEATQTEKENIALERKNEKYTMVAENWANETEINVNKEVTDKLSIQAVKVTTKAEETETEE